MNKSGWLNLFGEKLVVGSRGIIFLPPHDFQISGGIC